MFDITVEKVANFIVNQNDIIKRQKAMDAFGNSLNVMNNIELKKKQIELNSAKLEKMDADIFKTRVQAQTTIQKFMPKAAGIQSSIIKPSVGGDAPPSPPDTPPINLTAQPKSQESFDIAKSQTSVAVPDFANIAELSKGKRVTPLNVQFPSSAPQTNNLFRNRLYG